MTDAEQKEITVAPSTQAAVSKPAKRRARDESAAERGVYGWISRRLRILDPRDGLDGSETGVPTLAFRMRGPLMLAASVVLLFFGVLGGWAATARLESGAAAPGVVSIANARKAIQHLEGGIVADIRAREGELVSAGEIILVLADTQAQAGFDVYLERRRALAARIARLEAEWIGRDVVAYPSWLTADASDPAVADLIASQNDVFAARRQSMTGRADVLEARISQLQEQIAGLEAQIGAANDQMALIDQEIADISTLVDQGLAVKTRLTTLQREKAALEGRLGDFKASIARAEAAIGETRLQIMAQEDDLRSAVAEEIDEARTELSTIVQQIIQSEDVLERTAVRAPVSGRILNSQIATVGGVVRPGETLMEIVPETDELVVTARISPFDIDIVRSGLTAKVNLSAFSQRTLPQITGLVRDVSADVLTDEATGEGYYEAEIAVDFAEIEALSARDRTEYELLPGMPADVLIVTGERTVLQYLMDPLIDTFRRSFREA
ncbi:MAG: HlyD family type I secretion periplasmic adaptor subunit [Pseudomonadota bacterium]